MAEALAQEPEIAGNACSPQAASDALCTAARALEGVDFVTRLEMSAVQRGAGFMQVAQRLDLSPAHLDLKTCERLDARMKDRFEEAAASGQAPVERETAAQWLQDELYVLTSI